MAHNNSFTGKIHIFIIRRHFFKNKTNSLLLQSLFYDGFVKNISVRLRRTLHFFMEMNKESAYGVF